MINAKSKNKILGICIALFAIFGTANVALGATNITGDLPLFCQEGNPDYSTTFTFDDYETDTGCAGFDYWAIYVEDWTNTMTSIADPQSSSTNTTTAYFSIDSEQIADIESAGFLFRDFKYICTNDLESDQETWETGNSITTSFWGIQECAESGIYGGMFPDNSKNILTGSLISFVENSNVMSFVLIFMSLIICFYLLEKFIKLTEIKIEKERIKKEQNAEHDEEIDAIKKMTKEEKYWYKEEKKYEKHPEILTKENAEHFSKATGRNLKKFVE